MKVEDYNVSIRKFGKENQKKQKAFAHIIKRQNNFTSMLIEFNSFVPMNKNIQE